ncbi:LLM class flavin-dependent oxidoreductase [Pseudonocardia sp. MCCB 268]|nr:LLM class flavin-dependent oxidoreductase [Pseudonocardia cytotoxica]
MLGGALGHRGAIHKGIEQIPVRRRAGLQEAWVAEHNGRNYGIITSAQLMLAAAASATSRIRLGSG